MHHQAEDPPGGGGRGGVSHGGGGEVRGGGERLPDPSGVLQLASGPVLCVPGECGEEQARDLLLLPSDRGLPGQGLWPEGGAGGVPGGPEDCRQREPRGEVRARACQDVSPGHQAHALPPPHQHLHGRPQGDLLHGQGQPEEDQEADNQEVVL